jgi:hypothetical protein
MIRAQSCPYANRQNHSGWLFTRARRPLLLSWKAVAAPSLPLSMRLDTQASCAAASSALLLSRDLDTRGASGHGPGAWCASPSVVSSVAGHRDTSASPGSCQLPTVTKTHDGSTHLARFFGSLRIAARDGRGACRTPSLREPVSPFVSLDACASSRASPSPTPATTPALTEGAAARRPASRAGRCSHSSSSIAGGASIERPQTAGSVGEQQPGPSLLRIVPSAHDHDGGADARLLDAMQESQGASMKWPQGRSVVERAGNSSLLLRPAA